MRVLSEYAIKSICVEKIVSLLWIMRSLNIESCDSDVKSTVTPNIENIHHARNVPKP